MHRKLIYRLENVFPTLRENIVFSNIAAPLIQHCILTDDEYETVLGLRTENDRCKALINYLSGKTDSAFYTFLEILKVDYPWIVDEIFNNGDTSDVVDSGATLRPLPVSFNKCVVAETKNNCSATSNKRSGWNTSSIQIDDSTAPKRPNIAIEENSQIVQNSVTHPVENHRRISNIQMSNCSKNDKKESCNCSKSNCDINRSNISASDNISDTSENTNGNSAKLAQGVSEEMISVVKKNYRACTRWTSLAHALGLSSYVEKIRFKVMLHGEDLDLRIVYLLQEWMGERSKDATLNNLLIALRGEGFNDVADELEEKYTM